MSHRRRIEPVPSPWSFPDPESANEHGILGIGADLEPGTLLAAYRSGIFPMPGPGLGPGRHSPIVWWSPDPRAVLELDQLRAGRTLRRAARRFEFRIDTAFERVIAACADPTRPHGWIDRRIRRAYIRLHQLGWAHSVEAWQDGELVGGLYGVAIGGLFAGESMFHRVANASKAALLALERELDDGQPRLLDVQFLTPHLASLGAEEISRQRYLSRLQRALECPFPSFADDAGVMIRP